MQNCKLRNHTYRMITADTKVHGSLDCSESNIMVSFSPSACRPSLLRRWNLAYARWRPCVIVDHTNSRIGPQRSVPAQLLTVLELGGLPIVASTVRFVGFCSVHRLQRVHAVTDGRMLETAFKCDCIYVHGDS